MLDAEEDPDYVRADRRFEELRRDLEDKKRKRGDEKGGASAVLAQRIQAGAERGQPKKKKKSEKEKVTKALKVLSGGKAVSKSESSGEYTDEDDDDDGMARSSRSGNVSFESYRLRNLAHFFYGAFRWCMNSWARFTVRLGKKAPQMKCWSLQPFVIYSPQPSPRWTWTRWERRPSENWGP